MDILLARTDPPHNVNKSDLESTLDVSKLTNRQKKAIEFPLPYHPLMRKLLMLNPVTALASSIPVPLNQHPTKSLESYFKVEALLASRGSSAGSFLINDFFLNTQPKREILYPVGSPLSKVVEDHTTFDRVATACEQELFKRFVAKKPENEQDLNAMLKKDGLLDAPGMPFFTIGDPLGILGSFQEIQVHLTNFKKLGSDRGFGWEVSLRYILFDHFGCDDSDLEGLPFHGTPGQIAMWLLARDPAHGPGHKPFVVRIEVDRTRWHEDDSLFQTAQ
jgi:hypothetical protein